MIVTYQSRPHLESCIAAARSWSRTAKVVVVDNASTDGSAAAAEVIADVVVANPLNVGFGAGQNAGMRACDADFVLMLNPDATVRSDALERGFAAIEGQPEIALVQGPIRRAEDGAEERWAGDAPGIADLAARLLRLRERLGEPALMWLARVAGQRHYHEREHQEDRSVEFIAAVAPIVRRSAFEDVDGFDERMFLYAEDVDLCLRMRERGWRLLAQGGPTWADHVGSASSAECGAASELEFWRSHHLVTDAHWRGLRRWVGRWLTAIGMRLARRRIGNGPVLR